MTKTLKRVIALLSVSMFMALFSLSCFAQENSSAKKIYTEDLGDGIIIIRFILIDLAPLYVGP